MTGKTMLGSQIEELLSGLSDSGHQHLSEAEQDLVQTTCLLSEAIEKLGTSFIGIHEAVSKQQHAVEKLLAAHPHDPELAQHFKTMQGEIGVHVNSAVTNLQFQDMTNQLIDRTIRRVSGIKAVLGSVGAGDLSGLHGNSATEICALLENINKQLLYQSAQLEALLKRSVAQTGMESGDIELF